MTPRERRAIRNAVVHGLAIDATTADVREHVNRSLREARAIVREAWRDRLADRLCALDGETDPRARVLAIVATLDASTHARLAQSSPVAPPVPYGRAVRLLIRGVRS